MQKDDVIYRREAIGEVQRFLGYIDQDMIDRLKIAIGRLPSAQPEPLTDKEQRIFLAAMERERKVCKQVDDQYIHEPYETLLTKVCDEIKRKVKKVLWT